LPDIIQLLPDNIANQIAAGEVIQRPASAVKELLENAVDAGATEIKLFINDAGKSLIQVIDNGKGMSDTDARMAFERHATSKISNIEDLFHIKTMGFRGEALASIAAVAQVALKTKRAEDETGTFIEIENSKVLRQEPIASANGTSIAMKNVFFNVPARRNFLKSNAAEMRHVVDEFIRVAMAFPEVLFSLTSNGQQVFYLERGSLKQRIVQLLGANYNARLVTVQEKTDYLNIYGFIGKPETAKKTRGDQYFFVNNRFIKSGYLNHAVSGAYHDLLAPDSFATYVLFIDLDPAQIDINVHPTKQEIKFEDEKIVYAFVQAAIKHALAQFSITPTLEFDLDPTIQQLDSVNKPFTTDKQQAAAASDIFKNFTQKNQAHFTEADKKNAFQHWRNPAENKADEERQFSSLLDQVRKEENTDTLHFAPTGTSSPVLPDSPLLQLHNSFIVATLHNGFIIIYQQHAHERVLYEQFIAATEGKPMATQRSLFPVTLQFTPQDAVLLQELLPDLQLLGFLIEPFGANSFVIQGTPADVLQGNEKAAIENLLEQFKHYSSDVKFSSREKVIRSLVMQHSIKAGQRLTEKEMKTLVSNLFECRQPNATASGHPTYAVFENDYLFKLFGK
jgi:DNA mismatch repair protein MutL